MIDKIVRHVLESKLQDLPFAVLKNAMDKEITSENFLKYYNDKNNDNVKNFDDLFSLETRPDLLEEDYHYFEGWDKVVRNLSKLYGNTDQYYTSIMQTGLWRIGQIHAQLHNDVSDVVHLNCFGRVQWLLIDPFDTEKTEHIVILEPGDLLYMRGWTLHETTPLSSRASLIFMNLPYYPLPEDLSFLENQKENNLKRRDARLENEKQNEQ